MNLIPRILAMSHIKILRKTSSNIKKIIFINKQIIIVFNNIGA